MLSSGGSDRTSDVAQAGRGLGSRETKLEPRDRVGAEIGVWAFVGKETAVCDKKLAQREVSSQYFLTQNSARGSLESGCPIAPGTRGPLRRKRDSLLGLEVGRWLMEQL